MKDPVLPILIVLKKLFISVCFNYTFVFEFKSISYQVAAANGSEQVVRLLIMRGAGLDKSNIFGWTPLLQAAR